MNQKEWINYFEAVNGRKPSPEELKSALMSGTIARKSSKMPYYIGGGLTFLALVLVLLMFLTPKKQPVTVETSTREKSSSSTSLSSSLSSTSTESGSSEKKEVISSSSQDEPMLDLIAIQNGDRITLEDTWISEDGQVINGSKIPLDRWNLTKGYLSRSDHPTPVAGAGTMLLVPKGVQGEKVANPLVSMSFDSDSSYDRIVYLHLQGMVYYRARDIEKVRRSNQSIAFLTEMAKLIKRYRSDINESLAKRADFISGDFTPNSPSYIETRDYILHQSEADKIQKYESRTNDIYNVQRSDDSATFTVSYTTKIHYTDGRVSEEQTGTRDYTVRKINNQWYIEKF